MSDPFEPAIARALDAFAVPPLSAGFADRLMERAMAPASLPALPALAVPRRRWRGGWRRGGIVAAGIAAFGLMSAAAAAAGVFGDQLRQTVRSAPVLGPIIATVAPERARPVPKLAAKPRADPPVLAAAPRPAAIDRETVIPPPVISPREVRAQRIADRIERRIAARRALGLPPPRRRIVEKLRALPPDIRAEVVGKLRQARAERRAAITAMSPDERAALRETIRNGREMRRARRAQRWADQANEGVQDVSPTPN